MGGERVFSHRLKCDRSTANAIGSYRRFVDDVPLEISRLSPDELRNQAIKYELATDPALTMVRQMGERRRQNGAMVDHGFTESVWRFLDFECKCARRLNEFLLTEHAWTQFVGELEANRCFPEDFLKY